MLRYISILFFAVLLMSCSDDGGSNDFTQGDNDSENVATDGDIDAENVGFDKDNFSGLWVMKFAVGQRTKLPVLNVDTQMIMVGIARLKSTHNGEEFEFTEEICDINLHVIEDVDFKVIFTDQSIKAVPVKPRKATLSGTSVGSVFDAPQILDIYGGDTEKMSDPVNDPLPIEPDNDVVIDFENDGNPGLTGRVDTLVDGEVYVIMRMKREMRGIVKSETLIKGTNSSSLEMNTLAANPEYLKLPLDMTPIDNKDANSFEMVRVDKDYNCEQLLQMEKELFTYDPLNLVKPLDNTK